MTEQWFCCESNTLWCSLNALKIELHFGVLHNKSQCNFENQKLQMWKKTHWFDFDMRHLSNFIQSFMTLFWNWELNQKEFFDLLNSILFEWINNHWFWKFFFENPWPSVRHMSWNMVASKWKFDNGCFAIVFEMMHSWILQATNGIWHNGMN